MSNKSLSLNYFISKNSTSCYIQDLEFLDSEEERRKWTQKLLQKSL